MAGRPSKYRKEMAEQAKKLCRLGAIDKDLADFFEVNEDTINAWKKRNPEFVEALRAGKMQADAEVADKLYQRAVGYSHDEEKIFCNKDGVVTRAKTTKHYAPETVACIFWLKNRRPDLWRDRVEHTGKDGGPIEHDVSDMEVARRMAFVLTQAEKAEGKTH